MSRFIAPLVAALFAVSLGIAIWNHGGGVLPLDDAYIYLQYARSGAEGHFLNYIPGEPPTSGATSLPWLFVLVAVTEAASRFDDPVRALGILVVLLQSLLVAATLWSTHHLARRMGAGVIGSFAPLILLVLTPLWIFGAFNGMETALHGFALLGGAHVMAGGSALWLVLLALTRPEGAVLALILAAWVLLRPAATRPRVSAWLAVVAAGLMLAAPWIITGGASATWIAKSLGTEPNLAVRELHRARIPEFAWRTLVFGWTGGAPQSRVTEALALPGASILTLAPWVLYLGGGTVAALLRRTGVRILLLWVAASWCSLAAITWDAQYYRYLVAGYPLLAVAASMGWFARPRKARAGRQIGDFVPHTPWARLALVAVALLAVITVDGIRNADRGWHRGLALFAGECRTMTQQHIKTGRWIDENLPATSRVAVHDVGALVYHGHRAPTDLVGLVTPEMPLAYRLGEGALWEELSQLPRGRRPDHAAIVPAWMPTLMRTTWFLENVRDGGRKREPESQDLQVWSLSWPDIDQARWPGGDFGDRPATHGPPAGEAALVVVDRLDLADIRSERSHDFVIEPLEDTADPVEYHATMVRDLGFRPGPGFPSSIHAIEGGRALQGAITFVLRPREGAPGRLVVRGTSAAGTTLRVRVGSWSGGLRVGSGETVFREPSVVIPGDVFAEARDESGAVSMTIEGDPWNAFHVWLLQPRTE